MISSNFELVFDYYILYSKVLINLFITNDIVRFRYWKDYSIFIII